MNWLRLHTNLLESQKIQTLSPALFRAWVNLLCVSRLFDGVLPPEEEIAFRIRCTAKQASEIIAQLRDRQLIDETPNGLVMHDWDEHQYASDDAASRARRYRSRKKNERERDASRDGNDHVPCQNRTDTEQNRTEQKPVVVMPTFEKDRAAAWQWFRSEHPGELHEDYDCQIFMSVMQAFEDIAALRRNLPLWKASEKWQGGYAPTAENFLRKGIFKDAPKARAPTQEYKYVPPDDMLTPGKLAAEMKKWEGKIWDGKIDE